MSAWGRPIINCWIFASFVNQMKQSTAPWVRGRNWSNKNPDLRAEKTKNIMIGYQGGHPCMCSRVILRLHWCEIIKQELEASIHIPHSALMLVPIYICHLQLIQRNLKSIRPELTKFSINIEESEMTLIKMRFQSCVITSCGECWVWVWSSHLHPRTRTLHSWVITRALFLDINLRSQRK